MKRFIALLLMLGTTLAPTGSYAIVSVDDTALTNDSVYYIENEQAIGQSCGTTGSTTGSGTPADQKAREQKIWDALINAHFTPAQAAGIMGNMESEDGSFEPNLVQGGAHADVPPPGPKVGYGIVQWTPGSELIPIANPPALVHDLGWQIQTLINQLTKPGSQPGDETAAGNAVKATTNVTAAAQAFETYYERHGGGPQADRVTNAIQILAEFGSSIPPITLTTTTSPLSPPTATTPSPAASCGTTPATGITGNLAPGSLAWPITIKATITQCFVVGGHVGLDIAYTDGTPIFAAAAGTVVLAGGNDPTGYGLNYVAIQHSPTLATSYGHMGTMSVKAGDVVKQGQQIGTEDNQGASTGSHLHFNVYSGTAADAAAHYWNGNVDPLTSGLAIPPGVPNPHGCK